jgi:hypothetical protein
MFIAVSPYASYQSAKENSRRVRTGAEKGNLMARTMMTSAKTGQLEICARDAAVSDQRERWYEACRGRIRLGVAVHRLPPWQTAVITTS